MSDLSAAERIVTDVIMTRNGLIGALIREQVQDDAAEVVAALAAAGWLVTPVEPDERCWDCSKHDHPCPSHRDRPGYMTEPYADAMGRAVSSYTRPVVTPTPPVPAPPASSP